MIDFNEILQKAKEEFPWITGESVSFRLGALEDERNINDFLQHFQTFVNISSFLDPTFDPRNVTDDYIASLSNGGFKLEDNRVYTPHKLFSGAFAYEIDQAGDKLKGTRIEDFIRKLDRKTIQANDAIRFVKVFNDDVDKLANVIAEWACMIALGYNRDGQEELLTASVLNPIYDYIPGNGVLIKNGNDYRLVPSLVDLTQ